MTTTLTDITGKRMYEIDAECASHPDSVFIQGPGGFCVEFDKGVLRGAISLEYGIGVPVHEMAERILSAA